MFKVFSAPSHPTGKSAAITFQHWLSKTQYDRDCSQAKLERFTSNHHFGSFWKPSSDNSSCIESFSRFFWWDCVFPEVTLWAFEQWRVPLLVDVLVSLIAVFLEKQSPVRHTNQGLPVESFTWVPHKSRTDEDHTWHGIRTAWRRAVCLSRWVAISEVKASWRACCTSSIAESSIALTHFWKETNDVAAVITTVLHMCTVHEVCTCVSVHMCVLIVHVYIHS